MSRSTIQPEVPKAEHIVKVGFKTSRDAKTIGDILLSIAGGAYGRRAIPKGVSIEDYVNYKK